MPLRWFRRKPSRFDDATWAAVLDRTPMFVDMNAATRAEVRPLAERFVADKPFEGCGGLVVDDWMRIKISAQACAMVRILGLGALHNVRRILVYPDEFRAEGVFEDDLGIVSEEVRSLSGEAWSDGAVILSWRDVESAGDGYNVVVHEFAHQLDMLTGDQDGLPPLPDDATRRAWSEAFTAACVDLERREASGEPTSIDPYATENAAEAFAVFSEVFFESPALLALEYPAVHDHLARFYRI